MESYKLSKSSIWAASIGVLGALLAVLLMPLSRDYMNYLEIFQYNSRAGSMKSAIDSMELTYALTAYLTQNFFITNLLLGIIALSIKMVFFSKYRNVALIAIAYYFARFFIVHDVTQIRISFGIAMLLVAFNGLVKREYWLCFLFLVLAVVSHISTLVYVPIILFAGLVTNPRQTLKKALTIILILVPVVLVLANTLLGMVNIKDIVENLPDERLANYYAEEYTFEIPNLFTDVFFYLKSASLFALIFWPAREGEQRDLDQLYVRCGIVFMFSLAFFVVFHEMYAIASRLADIAAPFECLIVATFISRLAKPNQVFFSPFATLLIKIALTLFIVIRLVIAQAYLFTS